MTCVASAIFCQGGDKYNVYTVTVMAGVIYNHLVWQTCYIFDYGGNNSTNADAYVYILYMYIATASAITVNVWNFVKTIIFT